MRYLSFGAFKGTSLYKKCLIIVIALTVLQIILVGWVIKDYSGWERFFYAEDMFYEWLTAIFYFAASGILVFTFFKKDLSGRYKLFIIAFAILFFFVAMEEISWGQRILGIETPETLAEINEQGETTIHNLHTSLFQFLLKGGSLLLGVIIPVLYKSTDFVKNIVKKFEFPVMSPDFHFFFLLPITYYVGHRWIAPKLAIFIGLTVFLFIFFHLPVGKSFVKELPPRWGKYLVLIILILIPIMFQVHRYLIPLTDNKAGQEASEMILGFAYMIFAWAEFEKVKKGLHIGESD